MNVYLARWVVPVAGPPIENGYLLVGEEGQIAAVGPADELLGRPRDAERHELGESMLLPGLINAHAHLELTGYRDQLPRGPLWPWIDRLIELRQERTDEDERHAVRRGVAESLAAGVTHVADISRTGLSAEVLAEYPIRKCCYVELISGARRPPADPAALMTLANEISVQTAAGNVRVGVSPHALFTVTEADLADAACRIAARGLPVTVHLLETADEAQWLADGTGSVEELLRRYRLPNRGASPRTDAVDVLERTGLLALRPLLAHVNYVTDEQIRRLAEAKASVVFCPRAHAFFGHANHRWREMLAAGVNVCIGTDSVAGPASLSVLEELRFVWVSDPGVSAATVLEMGTLGGAVGLGCEDAYGALRPGVPADFVAVPIDPAGHGDPVVNLLESHQAVCGVWVGGRRLGPAKDEKSARTGG